MTVRADYDLIVVGAGPAGATMATLVKKYNPAARVLIVEKAVFPRHHVGESLLPGMIPVLKEMGVYDKINEGGFPRKMGVVFVWGKDRSPWDADFNNLNLEMVQKYGRLLDTEFSWQVLRSRYDEILLRHAESCGVEARLGWRAVKAIEEGGAIKGLVVESPEGKKEELRSRLLADCSGQNSFLSQVRETRRYDDELKNVAGYAYFKGAKWKFEYAGHPDKTKIFVCSVPEGWFWYIPLAADEVSVGLVSKASFVREKGVKDFRGYFFDALKRCSEIWPLLEHAKLLDNVDPAEPGKDFFSAGDWSFASEAACGEGWLAAGDAAFFTDPLLSSGVMMAHLSGHRAAYTINTVWREKDESLRAELWRDYGRFCREIAGSYSALLRYWYRNDPNAEKWWSEARRELLERTPVDFSEKVAFVAVASGLTYYFERAYTTQSLVFGSLGVEHSWQWEGTKLELKRWTRQILAIVETGFLRRAPEGDEDTRRAEAMVALQALDDAWVPAWRLPRQTSLTFLPSSSGGLLYPIHRVAFKKTAGADPAAQAADPKRVLPLSYMRILDFVDGERSIADIKRCVYAVLPLPKDILDGQLFRILKDLAVVGAIDFERAEPRPRSQAPSPLAGEGRGGGAGWEHLRAGERELRAGDPAAAERSLSAAIAGGARAAWAHALRGEARRHLGRLQEALADLDQAVTLCAEIKSESPMSAPGRMRELLEQFDAALARGWLEDSILIFRAKLRQQLGDNAGAREDAAAALAANPRQSEAYVIRAKAARALGDLDLARRDLKAAQAIEASQKKGEG